MQHEKCCYCEQKIPPEGHSKAVEHFKPKSIFRNLSNNWENLLLVCSQCNGKKSDKFPLQLCNNIYHPKVIWITKDYKNRSITKNNSKYLLINPSDSKTNPENELDYIIDDGLEDWGQIIGKTPKGRYTIETIDLSNSFHVKKRRDSLRRKLYPALLSLSEAVDGNDPDEIKVRRESFENLLNANKEYTGIARAFARFKKMNTKYGINIP
jgi:uncharacterized protein (TIGR02646 family)